MGLRDVFPTSWRFDGARAQVGGVAVDELAERYGTPLYVIDEAHIRHRLGQYRAAFGDAATLAYAAKAFFSVAMARVLADEGWWADVVSLGEAVTAMTGGLPASSLILHGNNKSAEELRFAARDGVGRVVIDHVTEIGGLEQEAQRFGRRLDVLLRITVDTVPDTHQKVRTSGVDAHFGLPSDAAVEAADRVRRSDSLRLRGVHVHLGSQVAGIDSFALAARELAEFVMRNRAEFPEIVEFDMGGGLAAPYLRDDPVPDIDEYAATIREEIAEVLGDPDAEQHRLIVEPGRSVVANAGVTLYRIGVRKDTGSGPPYLVVDGGMSDNPRPAMYGARYEAVIPERGEDSHDQPFRIVGRHCEAGDLVVPDAWLPADTRPGDLVAVPGTGAYTYSMSSRYNRVPRPPLVFVADGSARLVIRGETLDDLLAAELDPHEAT